MNTQQIRAEIDTLPIPERLALVADIWDSITASKQSLPLAQSQMAELDSRYQAFCNGEQSLHDWQEVHETLRNKYKI